MQYKETYMELKRIIENLKLQSVNELEELAEDMYDDVMVFFENIEVYENDEDLEEYGKELLSDIDIHNEIRDYVAYGAYAENFLNNQDEKDYICKFGNLYIYPIK